MEYMEVMKQRHSVRSYTDRPIPQDVRRQLDECAAQCSEEGGVHIRIRYDEPEGFDSRLAHYGSFRNVRNYIVLAGKKDSSFEYRCGYYGEKLVLYAQSLGLNTCWAALTFNKKNVRKLLGTGDSLCMVIALGYGMTQGVPHKGKSRKDVLAPGKAYPEWFMEGVDAALLAPTAVNQQKFQLDLQEDIPQIRIKGIGSCLKTDLGIAAYHFDAVTGRKIAPVF